MSSLAVSNLELQQDVATVIGVDRDPANWVGTGIDDDVDRVFRAGRRKFLSLHAWSFLEQYISISILAPASTGTVTIVNGVVTLAGSTWATNAAGQRLAVADSVYEVDTRDTATQLTLLDTSVNADAGTAYVLYFTRYSLPSNFAAFISPVTLENNREFVDLRELAVLPDFSVRGLNSRATVLSRRPEAFAITTTPDDETGVTVYEVLLYPLPDQAYVARSEIRINLGDALAEGGSVMHTTFSELYRLCVLSAAESLFNGVAGVYTEQLAQSTPDFIRKDRISSGSRRLLPRSTGRENYPRYFELITGSITPDTGV